LPRCMRGAIVRNDPRELHGDCQEQQTMEGT